MRRHESVHPTAISTQSSEPIHDPRHMLSAQPTQTLASHDQIDLSGPSNYYINMFRTYSMLRSMLHAHKRVSALTVRINK